MERLDSGAGSWGRPNIGSGSPTSARTSRSDPRPKAFTPPHDGPPNRLCPALDLSCPIPWPASQQASGSNLAGQSLGSRPSTWLAQRYYECLWMGECYFPLAEFVMAMDAAFELRDRAESEDSAALLVASIAGLLQSRNQIQGKFRRDLPLEVANLVHGSSGETSIGQISLEEQQVIRTSLRSGPGQLVAQELVAHVESQNPETDTTLKLKDEWLTAIERRELSLQILLVLEALRLSVEFPLLLSSDALSSAMEPLTCSRVKSGSQRVGHSPQFEESQSMTQDPAEGSIPEADSHASAITSQDIFAPSGSLEHQGLPLSQQRDSQDASQLPESQDLPSDAVSKTTKKRKRKSMTARRWTGFPTAIGLDGSDSPGGGFPWEKRPSKPGDTGGIIDENERMDDSQGPLIVRDPEKLHKRLESLVDRLSLRVITADLSNDISGLLGEGDKSSVGKDIPSQTGVARSGESQSVTGKSTKRTQFGTAARIRGDQDEMDELCFLYLAVIDPRFSRNLPRQCSTIRSRAVTSVHGSTPVRPKAGKSSASTSQIETSDGQRRREEQRLSKTRKELDLVSKGKTAEAKSKAREERRASQRPALRDALFAEEKEQRKGRSSSIAADAERNKREVSVHRRVGWARSVSTSQADANGGAGGMRRDSQSQDRDPRRSNSTSAPFAGGGAFSKRKSLEPQRFGGLFANAKKANAKEIPAGGPKSPPLAKPIDDDPFTDPSTKPAPVTSALTNSQRIVVTETPRKAKRIRPDLLPGPTTTTARSASSWGRTESQPVSARDLASLSASSLPRKVTAANPFHPPASNPNANLKGSSSGSSGGGGGGGGGAIHSTSASSTSVQHLTVPRSQEHCKRRSITASETGSRATSLAPSEEVSADLDDDNDDAASQSSSLTSMGMSDGDGEGGGGDRTTVAAVSLKQEPAVEGVPAEEEEEEEEEEMFFNTRRSNEQYSGTVQSRRPLHGLSGISNWVKSAATLPPPPPPPPLASLPSQTTNGNDKLQASTIRKPFLSRRPSGRNPFAKSASMQQINLGEQS